MMRSDVFTLLRCPRCTRSFQTEERLTYHACTPLNQPLPRSPRA